MQKTSPALVETDFLLALINRSDPLHEAALRALKRFRLFLSPYSLIELDLLILSGRIEVEDPGEFSRDVARELRMGRVSVASPKPEVHVRAWKLRSDGMGFFDSLHRALAETGGIPILSADRAHSGCESGWIDLRSV
ncbi:MAG: PIN domain-containing protein [Candidatus Korarchaeota archaeon]|nr:PIN domain-containing protein [Candidatus Korarchaeota archaeon]